MLPEIQARLADGRLVMCQVVESGEKTVAKFEGREFEIEHRMDAWRERPIMHWSDTRAGTFGPRY